jgi:hypothetical protein
MAANPLLEMNLEELRALIETVVEEKLGTRFIIPETRSVSEIIQSMQANLIQPAPHQPTTLEMIREDRNR